MEAGADPAPAVIVGGVHRGAGLTVPHRRLRGGEGLSTRKEGRSASHHKVRIRAERAFARMEGWKILRDRRPRGVGVRLCDLTPTG